MSQRYVGRPVRRREDPGLVSGRDPYVADVPLDGALVLALVRSPHAHAKIAGVETGAALSVPGVVAVVTGADVNADVEVIHTHIPPQMFDEMAMRGRTLLADGRVRYVGEPVVAVLGKEEAAAADGAEAVEVRYEPLSAIVDSEAALAPGSPLVHEGLRSNVGFRWKREKGDVDRTFAQAPVVIEATLTNQRVIPVAMEPRACAGAWDSTSGTLTVWADSQVPHTMRDALARHLKLGPERVHLRTARMGGGFGAKIPLYPEDLLVTLLARRLGRPVRWAATRLEDMQATSHGRDMRCHLRLAADATGRVLALDARIVANAGHALVSQGPILPVLCAQLLAGCYDIQTMRVEVTGAFTHTMGIAAYRGAGRPEAAYFIERAMDLLAVRVGVDPAEVRRRNFVPVDRFPYAAALGASYDSGDYAATLDEALRLAGYEELRRDQRRAREAGRLIGVGIASYLEMSGMLDDEVSDVVVERDGAVTVLTGSTSQGQGHETAFAQLVAEELQVPLETVTVVQGDTTRVRGGIGTFASRSLVRGGMHALENARRVHAQARRIAAELLEAAVEDVVHDGAAFSVRGVPDRAVSWRAVAAAGHGRLESRENVKGQGPVFPHGAHVAIVEVERETGRVRLLRYVAVDDSGVIVNPLLAEGQVHGGLAQGIGQALWEGAVFDESGQLLSASLMEYAIPRADDLIFFETAHTVSASPRTVLGVKGIGEAGTIGATPAVVNAVLDALAPLGVGHLDPPLTPSKIWEAINRDGRAHGDGLTPGRP